MCIVLGVSFALGGMYKAAAQDNAPAQIIVRGPNFVDKDGDGVGDNWNRPGKGGGKGKKYGRGARDGSGPRNTSGQRGPNFVDKNGDGICDNPAQGPAGK